MVFLNPLFLWTLLGLSVPVAIHFWSKKKVRTIKIGSTQLLRELHPKQTRSIRLNQWFLLLLRMLIISLIALILAGTRIEFEKSEKTITYLVEPSLLGLEKVSTILDTIKVGEVRLLQRGFPLLEEGKAESRDLTPPNYWQLAQQMETLQADSIFVFTKALLTGVKGMRPEIKAPIHWLVIASGEPMVTPIEVRENNDHFVVTKASSTLDKLEYEKETYTLDNNMFSVDSKQDKISIKIKNNSVTLPLSTSVTQHILVVYNDRFLAEMIYLSSAFRALSKYLEQDIEISAVRDVNGIDLASFDILIWLKQEPMIPFSGKNLRWQPDDLAIEPIEPGASKDQYLLRHHLDAENSLASNLPEQLIDLLELHQPIPENLEPVDQRTLDIQEIQVNQNDMGSSSRPGHLKDVSSWLWVVLLIVLPLERIISKYRKQ